MSAFVGGFNLQSPSDLSKINVWRVRLTTPKQARRLPPQPHCEAFTSCSLRFFLLTHLPSFGTIDNILA
eukprot:scaffold2723_cov192-Alexandrium_tamarense.AAC.6